MIDIPTQPPKTAQKSTSPPTLAKDENEKYESLLNFVKNIKDLPKNGDETSNERSELTDNEKFWLTKECLLRYLRAVKWSVKDGEKRLVNSLNWRRSIGLNEGGKLMTPDYVEPEQKTGKQLLFGYDNQSRPLWYMKPDRQNTDESPRQTDHAYWFLECAKILCPQGVENVSLLINYAKKAKGPSLSTSKSVMYNLADHYPETLGTAFVINLPTVVQWMFKIISPLLDPVTRSKLSFSNDCSYMVDKSQLENSFGGDVDLSEYDHEKYWKELNELVHKRRSKMFEKWVQKGKEIGTSEWELKDGEHDW